MTEDLTKFSFGAGDLVSLLHNDYKLKPRGRRQLHHDEPCRQATQTLHYLKEGSDRQSLDALLAVDCLVSR